MNTTQTAGKIVVGVDSSKHSRRALTWALNEARVRGVGCVVIHAWGYGLATATPLPGEAPVVLSDDAEALLARDVEFVAASGVPVEGMLVFGAAGRESIDASHDARWLSWEVTGEVPLRPRCSDPSRWLVCITLPARWW